MGSQPPPMQPQSPMQNQMPSQDEIQKTKGLLILAYILPILFFLPMISDAKSSKFAMYHSSQQLNLLLTWIIGSFLYFFFIGWLIHLFAFILMIIGIMNVSNGQMKPLPLIGGIKII